MTNEKMLEPFAKELERQERVRNYRDGDCYLVDCRLTIGDLRRVVAALAANQEAWVAALLNAPNPAALAATPAVGGEREAIARIIIQASNHWIPGDLALKAADALIAALPASPLRGRDDGLEEAAKYHDRNACDYRAIALVNLDNDLGADSETYAVDHDIAAEDIRAMKGTPPEQPAALPLAVRLRDEAGPPLPQMVAQRRAQLSQEQPAAAPAWREWNNDDLEGFHEEIRGAVLEAAQVFRKDDQDVGTVHRILAEGARRAALTAPAKSSSGDKETQ